MNVTMNVNFRILRVLCENVRLAPDLNLQHLAQLTPGYVGVDLRFLVTKAGQICIKRSCLFYILARIGNLVDLVYVNVFCIVSLVTVGGCYLHESAF